MDASTPQTARLLSHAERRRIIVAMMLPMFMGAIDQTVLASALPPIGREFGNVSNLPWLITAYLIAMTAATPLYGKISDIRGRRFALAIALSLHVAGSLACAFAPSLTLLILGRALQGLGGGGLTSIGMTVLGDIAPPKDRAKYYGYFSITYTTAGVLGPALGGALADYVHWSAIFWLNIPLDLAAMGFTLAVLRGLPRHDRPHRLDLAGAVLIVSATVSFMLALTMGGVRLPWASSEIIGLFAAAAIVGVLFVMRLMTAPEPLIPLTILKNSAACYAIATHTLGWAPIITLNIYLPIYLQDVLKMSATSAGLSLMVLLGTLNASAGFAAVMIARHRRYKIVPMIGLAVTILSVVILAWQANHINVWGFEILLAVIGIGFGPLAPLTGVSLQNAIMVHHLGSAVGAMNFMRMLFSTILVAIAGAITLKTTVAAVAVAQYQTVFLVAVASLTASFITLWLMEERPLSTDETRH